MSLLLVGCIEEAPPPPEPAEEEPQAEPVAYDIVGQGLRGSLQDTLEVAIRDSARWTQIRQQLRSPAPFRPVDFDQAMVLLAALPVPSGGYDLRFETVERTDSALVAEYMFAEPDDDCMAGMGRSVPFQAIVVPRADAPVRFERHHDTYRCTTDTGF